MLRIVHCIFNVQSCCIRNDVFLFSDIDCVVFIYVTQACCDEMDDHTSENGNENSCFGMVSIFCTFNVTPRVVLIAEVS
jgi:hypothetical protein